jgi:uncharacterized integral membrane protein
MSKDSARTLTAVVAVALTIAFAVANSQYVTVDWLVTSTDSRLIYVVVASAAVGAIVGYTAGRGRGRSRDS